MTDWGGWIIAAAIIWPDGHIDRYQPTTQFDRPACIATAQQINHDWQVAQIVGFAACRKADDE